MKIYAAIRTRNEEANIERFVMSYQWADKIIITDGGSDDNTVEIARRLPKTEVRTFLERAYRNDDEWINPHGRQINFLARWAESELANWIIFDDCDCVPNYAIKECGRELIEEAHDGIIDFILANRVYVYGEDQYFQGLTCPSVPDGQYKSPFIPSLWAWRLNRGFYATEDDPFVHGFNKEFTKMRCMNLYPPYCLLHYFYPNDEVAQQKRQLYSKIYHRETKDPKEFGGELLPLEEWMRL